jgi:hypothetical protein
MKRAYRQADELGKQRAIGKFRELAAEGASVQLALPLAEVMQMVQDGCGQLLREAGLRLMMGQRGGLLCSRWTEGADRPDPFTQQRRW